MPHAVREIDKNDEEIKQILQHAHLPSLVNVLVHLTGDSELLKLDLHPVPMRMGETPAQNDPELEQRVRNLALGALSELRDHGESKHAIDESLLHRMLNFMTGVELPDKYIPYAMNELDIAPRIPKKQITHSRSSEFKVAIIGGGMSGLLAGIKMQELGLQFTIFEKNDEVGGTWYENRYPGCRVDSPNHVYSYSFKQKDWPQHFSDRNSLLSYFKETADDFNLRQNIQFQTEVDSLRFDSETSLWHILVKGPNCVEEHLANVVIAATGQLNRPKMPDIEGIESFQGDWFHSADWNHDIALKGKKVGIIGTGASAFQFTPEVVKEAADVTVFLRTPPWVATSPVYHQYISDEVHWLFNHVPYYQAWFRFHMFWTSAEGLLTQARCDDSWNDKAHSVSPGNDRLRRILTHGLASHLEGRDDLIEKLTPSYPPTAKRMLIDNGHWYRALKEPHVNVIDEKIVNVNSAGVLTESNDQHDFDVIIYGTGFSANKFLFPMRVYGRDGSELRESWNEDPRAYLGVTAPNLPNFFFLYGPNTNLVVNGSIIFFSECEMQYVTECLRHLLENDYATMECRNEPFSAYNERIDADNLQMAWGASDVNAWYKNSSGRVTQCWPGSLVEFWQQLRDLDPSDYEFTTKEETKTKSQMVGTAGFEPATA